MKWTTRSNGYEGKRAEFASGELEFIADAQGNPTVEMRWANQLIDWRKSLYIIDDGKSARIMYPVGWRASPERDDGFGAMWLQDIPTNPAGAVRPDTDRVIDYSTWMLTPRRTYHLKVHD